MIGTLDLNLQSGNVTKVTQCLWDTDRELVMIEGELVPHAVGYAEEVRDVRPLPKSSDKQDKVEGTVILTTVIDTQGRVQNPTVAESSGNADLDRAAADTVAQWIFQPATLDGKPVEVYYTLTIRFTLD